MRLFLILFLSYFIFSCSPSTNGPLSEEKKVLVNQRDFQRHKNDLQEIRDGVGRLEKRIALLQKSKDRV